MVQPHASSRYCHATETTRCHNASEMGTIARMEPWAEVLIRESRVAILGTIDAQGRPHLVPVCFARFEGAYVIAVDEKPKRPGTLARVRNIQRDPRCTLLFQRYDDDWTQLAWVRIEGLASIVARGAEMPRALAALRASYRQYGTMDLESRELIVVTPERAVCWRWEGL